MEKIWLSQYQDNVPEFINLDQSGTLVDIFEASCRSFPDRIAYLNLGCELTYAETEELSRHLASYFQKIGLKKGDRIAIMMPNVLQYPITLFAALRAGLMVVNTNPLYTKDELVHQLNDSGAKAIVVLTNFAQTVEQALPECKNLEHIITTQVGDLFPHFKRLVVNTVIKHVKKMVPHYRLPEAVSFVDAIKQGSSSKLQAVPIAPEDIAFLQYTGGTTGVSKAAMLTHKNMVANILQATAWLNPLSVGSHDIIITALPLYHVFSLTANCLTFFKMGATSVLITNPRDISQFIKQIKHIGFTAITGVNTLFNALLNHPKFDEIDFTQLKLALSGGMSLQKSVSLKWQERTQSRVLEAYGLTETSPAVTINPMYLTEYNGSIGLPLPSTDISIRDEQGQELPLGEQGELCIKGPQVMQGYWQRQDETDLVFWPDGFLRTGDIATIDEKGFIYLVDRKKDMILVSGFNVYPNEVEQVISLKTGVLEVGVVGIPADDAGEKVKACIVKKDPHLTEEDIIIHCRQHLTPYKIPKVIEFYEELPKTNVGKILRRALR